MPLQIILYTMTGDEAKARTWCEGLIENLDHFEHEVKKK